MTEIWLKLTGNMAQARAALRALGMAREMLGKNEKGDEIFAGYNHDVAMELIPNLITKFATHDEDGNELTPAEFGGPHLTILLGIGGLTEQANTKARERIVDRPSLPAGLQKVSPPDTWKWARDP